MAVDSTLGDVTILIVDDEESLVLGLAKSLRREGFAILTARDGEACVSVVERNRIDLILLDVMLPKLDGMTVCRRIREHCDTPIIMLTAKTDVIDRVLGLELGADDYVTKPFHTRELIARIRSVARRSESRLAPSGVFIVGKLSVDPTRRSAAFGERSLDLTPHEFDILLTLVKRPGKVFTREQLVDSVWEEEFLEPRNVDSHISRIREKLEEDPAHPVCLLTKWGVGYYVNDAP